MRSSDRSSAVMGGKMEYIVTEAERLGNLVGVWKFSSDDFYFLSEIIKIISESEDEQGSTGDSRRDEKEWNGCFRDRRNRLTRENM